MSTSRARIDRLAIRAGRKPVSPGLRAELDDALADLEREAALITDPAEVERFNAELDDLITTVARIVGADP